MGEMTVEIIGHGERTTYEIGRGVDDEHLATLSRAEALALYKALHAALGDQGRFPR